jgi:glycosyltransferase involved in cell wall biosynthesis
VKFTKYLPHFDVEPLVLTRKEIAYHSFDEYLEEETKHVSVISTESLDPARILYVFGMRQYHPQRWQTPIKQAINFPDNKFGWIPFAYRAGVHEAYDSIFVTAPPFSTFITGYYLARHTGKPLILDFRDAWLEFPFMPYTGRIQRSFASQWEKKVINAAAHIVTVDDNIKDTLTQRYPTVAHRISVIPNGYDPDDFTPEQKVSTFTITHLGTVRKERDPEPILRAVQNLIESKKVKKNAIQVQFIGHVEQRYQRKIRAYAFTSIAGHIPHRKALHLFSSGHVGLLITTGSTYFFPSRQNEYLASGLPIIVCGASRGIHLIEKAFDKGYPGWIYKYDDTHGMQTKVLELYHDFQRRKIWKGETPYLDFTREKLTEKLAKIVHSL